MTLTVIRTGSQCEQLARATTPFSVAGATALTLDLPIDGAVQARYQADIDRLVRTCGCVASASVMLTCLVPSLIGIWRFGLGDSLGLRQWVLSIVAVILSLMLGLAVKILIQHSARRRLREALLRLARLCGPALGT